MKLFSTHATFAAPIKKFTVTKKRGGLTSGKYVKKNVQASLTLTGPETVHFETEERWVAHKAIYGPLKGHLSQSAFNSRKCNM
jgi:hypothetical protein